MEMTPEEMFNLTTEDGETFKNYLKNLLETLWIENEGFSGKRPFGNSGWEYDLYIPLAKANLINGKFADNGYLLELDVDQGHKLILSLIRDL